MEDFSFLACQCEEFHDHLVHLHLRREKEVPWSEQVSLSNVLLKGCQTMPAWWLGDLFKEWGRNPGCNTCNNKPRAYCAFHTRKAWKLFLKISITTSIWTPFWVYLHQVDTSFPRKHQPFSQDFMPIHPLTAYIERWLSNAQHQSLPTDSCFIHTVHPHPHGFMLPAWCTVTSKSKIVCINEGTYALCIYFHKSQRC